MNYKSEDLEHFVICVDDDRDFLKSLEFFLPDKINQKNDDGLWYRFLFFTDPSVALDTIQELKEEGESIAMVITDQKMPKMRGIELLSEVKRISSESMKILLTGHARIDSAIVAINENLLDKYLTKPINDEHDFILSIWHMLQRYHMQKVITFQHKIIRELYEFANVLNGLEDFQQTLQYILSFTGQQLECEQLSLMLYEDNHLCMKSSQGIVTETVHSLSIPCGKETWDKVFEAKRPLIIKSLDEIPYLQKEAKVDRESFIALPLLMVGLSSLEQPLGIINVSKKKNNAPFNNIDIETLTYIANTASIALHNHINRIGLQEAYFETKTQATRLEYQVMHDSLTGFPNRMMLRNKIHEAIQAGQYEKKPCALCIIELDNYEKISNRLTVQYENILLQEIGKKIQKVIRKSDMLALFAHDKFAVFLQETTIESVNCVVQSIVKAMKNPVKLEDFSFKITTYIGLSVYPDHGEDLNILIRKAEVALNIAKTSGENYRIYNAHYDKQEQDGLAMLCELRSAFEKDQLALYYQPRIDLTSNLVTSIEVSVRWHQPQYGFMPSDRFTQFIDHTNLTTIITEWVLNEALHQCSEWQKKGKNICMGVSISARNLQDEKFPDRVRELLAKWDVEPKLLEIEIPENTAIATPELAKRILNHLSDMGVLISIDDFGTGYSSKDYIKQLPITAIKIDRSFVMNMGGSENNFMIVNVAIDLSQKRLSKMDRDGLQGEEIFDFLVRHGCTFTEGYFMARPICKDEFQHWANV
ncbi:MAG: EAL domain-containing protein [bacterium]